MKYQPIPPDVSIHLRYLRQDLGLPGRQLVRRYPQYSPTSIYRHSKLPIGEPVVDGRKNNRGRPRKIDARTSRRVVQSVEKLQENSEEGTFFSSHVQEEACVPPDVSNRTVRRCLNDNGYSFTQCRKKGLLTKEDMVKRLKFARKCKRSGEGVWKDMAFYLDGTGWVHKSNPCAHARTYRTRMWRKKKQGLKRTCTAKGKKEGVGGKMAKFFVAFAYGKGVVKCKRYEGSIDGAKFAHFVRTEFPSMFKKSPKPQFRVFLQDGDPSQNSAIAKAEMKKLRCSIFTIPARSPDLNPIENMFHLCGKAIRSEAIRKRITKESYAQFCNRVRATVMKFSKDTIDKSIESMPKRIQAVIDSKGARTKY